MTSDLFDGIPLQSKRCDLAQNLVVKHFDHALEVFAKADRRANRFDIAGDLPDPLSRLAVRLNENAFADLLSRKSAKSVRIR